MAQAHPPHSSTRFTRFQRFLSSRLVTGLGMLISKHAPPFIGYRVADLIAGLIILFKPSVYWVVCDNLRQVLGQEASERELHRVVRRVFVNNARNLYTLWHVAGWGRDRIDDFIHVPSEEWDALDQSLRSGKGLIVAGTHTGNFDLGMLALAASGRDIQVLGLAAPPGGGFDLMDRMREKLGLHLTSIGVESLLEAVRRLRDGGGVLTGVDRPVGDEAPTVTFFGRPALLPTGHVRLALKTGAVIFVACTQRDPERGGNVVRMSPPIDMVHTGDPDEDMRVNMRRVAAWLEKCIAAVPEQWSMFVPVWPQAAEPDQGGWRSEEGA